MSNYSAERIHNQIRKYKTTLSFLYPTESSLLERMGFSPKAEGTVTRIFRLTAHPYCDPRGNRPPLSSHYDVHKSSGGLCHAPGVTAGATRNQRIRGSLHLAFQLGPRGTGRQAVTEKAKQGRLAGQSVQPATLDPRARSPSPTLGVEATEKKAEQDTGTRGEARGRLSEPRTQKIAATLVCRTFFPVFFSLLNSCVLNVF